ncbi:hypothetical protein [Bradyrhizobium sp. SZCCHNS1054]|uniref:hypothetical protein n=1 Tax=Bradyrhizobium sp. SZCCHNS1054 TaxID=3057301 RepID=UPI002915FDBB|nr:hypothetical protein [Bradyrhizobium sp. SZCCHNS1054]
MTNNITKRIVAKALTEAVIASWLVGAIGQHGEERLLNARWRPTTLKRLCIALQNAEDALGRRVNAMARRFGIDMDDVLEPLIAARIAN